LPLHPLMAHPTLPFMIVLVPQGQHVVAEASSGPWMAVEMPVSALIVAAVLGVVRACMLIGLGVQRWFDC
jgi:hypothetical protein